MLAGMVRPKEYDNRIDTKVRLRQDHVDRLAAHEAESGLARNRIIEQALDVFFGIRTRRPKLVTSPPPDVSIGKGSGKKATKRTPHLARLGEEYAAQSEARSARPTPQVATPKTRVRPRSAR